MQTAADTLPHYKAMVINDDVAGVAVLSLSTGERAKVFELCALTSAPRSAGWVDLIKGWGVDLDRAPLQANGMTSRNWLWNALARGKIEQALALVRAGFGSIEVDEKGRSGLAMLIEDTYHDRLRSVLDMLVEFERLGMGWKRWPDALDFDARMRKNVGASLGELLSDRAANALDCETAQAVSSAVPTRL